MQALLTGDLHLTDRKEDAYRWDFFDWLHGCLFDALVLVGDLCDSKDYHSASLVNRVVEELLSIVEEGRELHVLMGNHDYTDPRQPFFKFFRFYSNCFYHSTAGIWEIGNARWAFYPHSRTPELYFDDMCRGASLGVQYTLCHQVFSGAVSESGRTLPGCTANISGAGKVFSGDVHVPQIVGGVEYLGSPYPIRFGDQYTPRVVLVDSTTKDHSYLYPPYPQKLVLEISRPEDLEYNNQWRPGDHVRIVLRVRRADFTNWEKYRRAIHRLCAANDLMLCGLELRERVRNRLGEDKPECVGLVSLSPAEQYKRFCNQHNISSRDLEVGLSLLEE